MNGDLYLYTKEPKQSDTFFYESESNTSVELNIFMFPELEFENSVHGSRYTSHLLEKTPVDMQSKLLTTQK